MSSVDGKVEWKMVIIKNLFDHIVPAQAQLADSFALPTYTFFSRIIRKFCIFSDDSIKCNLVDEAFPVAFFFCSAIEDKTFPPNYETTTNLLEQKQMKNKQR